jgi:hypothetical protein
MIPAYIEAAYVNLRKRKLEGAWEQYPLYDPPQKVEERLLTRDRAEENFEYFMRVRQQRVAYLRDWLRSHFRVTVTLDKKGIGELSRWARKYAGLLLVRGSDGRPTLSFFTYHPSWTAENTGHNILFDVGIIFGDAIISNCPNLRWEIDPISAVLPRTAERLRRSSGMSFQRPMLAGFNNPATYKSPLHDVYIFAAQMMYNCTTLDRLNRFYNLPMFARNNITNSLVSNFDAVLKMYPSGDPGNIKNEMTSEYYQRAVDSEF